MSSEARKLLDSLMGQTRDASLEEAKKSKGENFRQDSVCKRHLLGFCPQHELSNSKLVSKRNLGDCKKVHSDAMKTEYEKHPEKGKYQAEYEKQFLPFLESQIREADSWVARERANVQKAATSEKTTISTMPDTVKEQMLALTTDMNKMMAGAEDLAEKGDIEGSKFKVELADEIKESITDIQEKYPEYEVTLREEWVCEVCGTRLEAVQEQNPQRFQAHFTGKVHAGYAKIRDWVKDIRKRQRAAEVTRSSREEKEEKEGDNKKRSASGSKDDRRKNRSRSRGRRDDRRGGDDRRDDRRGRDRDDRGRDRDDRGRRR